MISPMPRWRVRSVIAAFLACAVVAAGCSGSSHKAVAPTTTQRPVAHAHLVVAVPTAPLTGLPDPKKVARRRPAVTVKINNTDAAKQYGIDRADVVYEEVVEGGITRLAAIFNSQAPDKVGPVRSVRKTDQSIVWPIGGIFAYSGGAAYAIASIDTAPVKQLDETRAGSMMYRDPVGFVYEPLNLWARVDQMFTAGGTPIPPPPLFLYRGAHAALRGTPALAFVVGFAPGYAVTWNWDAASRTWLRSKFGAPDVDGDGVRLSAKNVVVMFVNYLGGAGVEQSEAQLTGSGTAWVFTGGKEIKGTWTRPDKNKPARYLDAQGRAIRLAPGPTWVELPDVSYPVTVLP
jgi:hypothetical protein